MLRVILLLCCVFVSSNSFSETYKDIGPLDTLGEVKSKFPNAIFEQLKPSWAQETDVMYMIYGQGMSGKIIINFYDARPKYRKFLQENTDGQNSAFYKDMIAESDEEAMTVDWIRWLPDNLIPLSRFVSKYGKYDKSGFSDENFQPYRSWENIGLAAFLTDDEKNVMQVDYVYTKSEMRKAYMKKYGQVPPFLQDTPPKK